MPEKNNKVQNVTKPFLRGNPTDSTTIRSAAMFLLALVLTGFMSFLVCSMTGFDSAVLRIAINLAILTLIMIIFFHRGQSAGTETVARSETMFQRREKGHAVSESEKALCYHPLKGWICGFLGTLPVLILCLILAFTATKARTGAGALPGWMEPYLRRSEISDSLTAYTVTEGLQLTDIIRILVRISIMPLISMAGHSSADLTLLIERLSPLAILFPALSYGFGYTRGIDIRTRIHTEIAENARKRKKREMKKRREREAGQKIKEPGQLN